MTCKVLKSIRLSDDFYLINRKNVIDLKEGETVDVTYKAYFPGYIACVIKDETEVKFLAHPENLKKWLEPISIGD